MCTITLWKFLSKLRTHSLRAGWSMSAIADIMKWCKLPLVRAFNDWLSWWPHYEWTRDKWPPLWKVTFNNPFLPDSTFETHGLVFPGFQASATTEQLQGENEYSPSDLAKEDGHLNFQERYTHLGVSKNRGKTPKMDGLFHGKPY